MKLIKTLNANSFLLIILLVTIFCYSCTSSKDAKEERKEDLEAKEKLQGAWQNELEGSFVFAAKGDSIFYNDSLSTPTTFYVYSDTLFVEYHSVVKYRIKRLNSSQLVLVNADGDELELIKKDGETYLARGEYKGAISLNQGKKIKNDTIVRVGEKSLHVYSQVNPTTYKVFRQTKNDEGMAVENVYYDNIVYIALFEGNRKAFSRNVVKNDFKDLIPKEYIEQAVLSEVKIEGVTADAVRFVAYLSIPDTYTNYRVNIDVTPDGKEKKSL